MKKEKRKKRITGSGRVLAELENSKCPGSTPENLRTQGGRKFLCERNVLRVLEGRLRNWNRRENAMNYVDELILWRREEKRKEQYSTLEEGVYMNGETLTFGRKDILGVMEIMLPDEWKQMPEKFAKIKYPSEFRPGIILTSTDLEVNMGFTVFPQKIPDGTAGKIVEHMQAVIHRSNPDYPMLGRGKLEKTGGSWFAFRSHALDSDLYNMMMVMSLDGKMLQGIFNCPYKDYRQWEKVAIKMWESIIGGMEYESNKITNRAF